MTATTKDQTHGVGAIWEDLEVLGGSSWQGYCLCGWRTRHCSTAGTVYGLIRRHAVVAGR
jgi:hypothetical protein